MNGTEKVVKHRFLIAAMLFIYSLLDNHPASDPCELFIRDHVNWSTTTNWEISG